MNRRRVALLLLFIVHAIVGAAGFLSPFDPAQQHRQYPLAPPIRPHLFDDSGRFHGLFVYGLLPLGEWAGYHEDRSRRHPIHFFSGGRLWTADPDAPFFLLGSDENGRDQFSRLLHGGRISLSSGLLAALLSIATGMMLGMLSGYRGGWRQTLILRSAELCLALPWLYFLLGVRAFLPLSLPPEKTLLLLTAVIGLVGWARPATVANAVTRGVCQQDWVHVSRGFGASDWHVLRNHVLPEMLPIALAQAVILIPRYVLAEVTLSFLGLGIQEPGVSWGLMLSAARQFSVLVSDWWLTIPCLAVAIVFHVYQFAARSFESLRIGYTDTDGPWPVVRPVADRIGFPVRR